MMAAHKLKTSSSLMRDSCTFGVDIAGTLVAVESQDSTQPQQQFEPIRATSTARATPTGMRNTLRFADVFKDKDDEADLFDANVSDDEELDEQDGDEPEHEAKATTTTAQQQQQQQQAATASAVCIEPIGARHLDQC
jgi:hypothetical protein